MIEAVLFDLDETLIVRSAAIRAFVAAQYARFEHRLGGISRDAYASAFLAMEEEGRIDKELLYPALVNALALDGVSADELLDDYRANYPRYATLAPGTMATIKALRAMGLATGIVSNGHTDVQSAKIAVTVLGRVMDAVVISEAVGLRKPDPAIFRLAAGRLGVPPAACLFVGDNPEVDIVGAAGAGLRTAWVHNNGVSWPEGLTPRPDAIIESLNEVPALAKPSRRHE